MYNFDNLSRYRIFLSVADCKSISKAAAELYISQPAVSSAIKKLEESLCATLFLRKPRGVELTDSGRLLYEGVKKSFGALAYTEDKLRNTERSGRLRIAASSVLCKHILMPYLQAFTVKYPSVDVSITCISSANAHKMLMECEIDIALTAKPDNISGMNYHSLGSIEDIFVCSPAYIKRLGCSDSEIFEFGNIMLLNSGNVSRTHINNYYAENNINPPHILEVSDMDLLIEFAKIGIGVSCVVKEFVIEELQSGALTEIKLPKPVRSREIGFLYNDGIRPFNDNITKFIQSAKVV